MGLGVPPSYRYGDSSDSDGFRPVGEVSPVESATRDELRSFLAGGEVEKKQTPVVPTRVDIDGLVDHAIRIGASDILLQAGDNVAFKVRGDIVRAPEYGTLGSLDMDTLLEQATTNVDRDRYSDNLDLDTSYQVRFGEHAGRRLRVNVARSQTNPMMTCRVIGDVIPSPEELGVAPILYDWANSNVGFTLICGTTGSGKTTTLAALLNKARQSAPKNIATLEDPIEFVFPNLDGSPGRVTQREKGQDFRTWQEAINSVLRQNPDIALIAEIRDHAEIKTALTLAESGHNILTTLHASSASAAVSRIIAQFEPHEQAAILNSLASNLTGVCVQNLVRSPDKSQYHLVQSIFPNTLDAAELIAAGDVRGIERMEREGGQSMWQLLANGVRDGRFNADDARSRVHPRDMRTFDAALAGA